MKWLHYTWFFLSCILLLVILKPYNRASKPLKKPDYIFNDQSQKENGYVVDYDGVIDLVSQHGPVQCELQVTKTLTLNVQSNLKEGSETAQVIFLRNGYPEDSVSLATGGKKQVKLRLRKNDYLKIEVSNPYEQQATEVSVKLAQSNRIVQQAIYAVILLWLILGLLVARYRGVNHLFLPSIALLLAVYSEHLYPADDWFRVLIGFVLLAILLAFVRSLLRMVRPTILRWIVLFAFDVLQVAIILFCLSFVMNYLRFGIRMDFDSIVAVLQSNRSEMIEFAKNELPFWGWIGILLVVLLPFIGLVWPGELKKTPSLASAVGFIAIAGIVGSGLVSNSKFGNEFFYAYQRYYEEISKFNEVQHRLSNPGNLDTHKDEKGETYIVVIGESQSKEHMSLYGYHRPTTPFLDSMSSAGELVVLDQAYSSHTHTIMVLQEALTQANQYNGLNFTQVPTLMNVLNAAGFETVWLSNQVRLSNWDNVVSAIAEGCDEKIFVNKRIGETVAASPYDERVLPELDRLLSENGERNKIIFVHLMGNHGNYDERYPPDFEGLESKGKADYGLQPDPAKWEQYDNSILYNDWIMRGIMTRLGKSDEGIKALCYFADHAEDLQGGRGHNIGKFTYRMTQIPMYFWFSDDYKRKYPNVVTGIESNAHKYFSNDLTYQTLLGLTQVKTSTYDARFDLTSKSFELISPKIKSGKIDYMSPENPYVQTARNVDSLDAWGMRNRVGAHRVNSYGKYDEVYRSGVGLIEFDIKIREGEHGVELEVGHGEDKVMSGQTLTQFLRSVPMNDSLRFWLDVKNLKPENITGVVKALTRLDVRYNLKDRLIVETSQTGSFVKAVAQAGFHLSYYLPTDVMERSKSEQQQIVNQVISQVSAQSLSAVSFDSKLYPWVLNNLEGRLPLRIVYHTWDLGLDIRHGDFTSLLSERPYFRDKRVHSVLTVFPSVFEL